MRSLVRMWVFLSDSKWKESSKKKTTLNPRETCNLQLIPNCLMLFKAKFSRRIGHGKQCISTTVTKGSFSLAHKIKWYRMLYWYRLVSVDVNAPNEKLFLCVIYHVVTRLKNSCLMGQRVRGIEYTTSPNGLIRHHTHRETYCSGPPLGFCQTKSTRAQLFFAKIL